MAVDVKKVFTWVGVVVIFILIVVPYIVIAIMLKKQGKRIELIPEIKIVEITNDNPPELNALSEALQAAQAISKKIATKNK